MLLRIFTFVLCAAIAACSTSKDVEPAPSDIPGTQQSDKSKVGAAPFTLPADLSGFLLLWFDSEGVHSADSVEEIPDGAKSLVRVRPLDPEVEGKLDPLLVYVTDLRKPATAGTREVRAMKRTTFDAKVDEALGVKSFESSLEPPAASGKNAKKPADAPAIIVYRTDWCGVCRQAAAWLDANGYAFTEKDVEKDPGAAREVQQKLAAAGKSSRGVPVIDVGGQLMVGFDPGQLKRMIDG